MILVIVLLWLDLSVIFTLQATTAGILTTLGHCVDVMNQREESFKRRLEREGEKRKRLEEKLKHALSLSAQEPPTSRRVMVMGGPDYEVCRSAWS